jgi:hypothetical protein
LSLDLVGYYSVISLPLSHAAGESALLFAARRGAMKKLSGDLGDVRAARARVAVGELDRTLVVVESEELREGQKRGIAVALVKATAELEKLARHVGSKKIRRASLTHRVKKALRREHLSTFVIVDVGGTEASPTLAWHVNRRTSRDHATSLSPPRSRLCSLELEAAVRARAGGQGRRGPARRARRVLGVARHADGDGRQAFAREAFAPVVAQELGELGELILLDQEVRLGPSTLAGAGRTADEGGDAGGQAAIAQRLHLGDRAGDRRDEGESVE